MYDVPRPTIGPQSRFACVRLNTGHWYSDRVARLLEAVGGHPIASRDGTLYRFITGIVRDDALDLVRSRFGWTVADAFNLRPCRPG